MEKNSSSKDLGFQRGRRNRTAPYSSFSSSSSSSSSCSNWRSRAENEDEGSADPITDVPSLAGTCPDMCPGNRRIMSKHLDPAREWGIHKDGEPSNYFYCKFCNHHITAGITRLKHHLASTRNGIKVCERVPVHVKKACQEMLQVTEIEKKKKLALTREIWKMGELQAEVISQELESAAESNSQPRTLGAIDKFINVDARQSNLETSLKEAREDCVRRIGRCIFANGLSFDILNSPYWKEMIEAVGNFGFGLKQPSPYEIRTRVLKAEVEDIDKIKEKHVLAWEKYGCTVMSDGWSDRKSRSLINFLVNSPEGTFFYKSIDASDQFKTGTYLWECIDKVVEEIGEKNVVQVITDNHAYYVNVGTKLMESRKCLYWTPCAAHCIDLMLEDIGKMKIHKETLDTAKGIIQFIYNHCWVLSLMRTYTKGKELLRPAITRFATSFLTLQRLYKLRLPIRKMFASDEFTKSVWAKKPNAIKAKKAVLSSRSFWGRVLFCFRTTLPLVYVLREVDSDVRPSMPFLYEMLDSCKKKIADVCDGNKRKYMPYWNMIDKRWTDMLHRPLHAAAYFLNPRCFYSDTFSNILEVRRGLRECMQRMIPDLNEYAQADIELDQYKQKLGEFGSPLAQMTMNARSPATWWERFGEDVPILQKFAIRILSLTTSASGCERNWSTFEQVHSKKRCRLEQERLHSLVYVMYNIKLRERNIWRKRMNLDPILIDEATPDDEWLVESEEPCLADDLGLFDDRDENIVDTGTRDFLDVTAINSNQNVMATTDKGDKQDENEITRKKRRVDTSSSFSDKRKSIDDVVDETGDDIDPEDVNYILYEDDLVVVE